MNYSYIHDQIEIWRSWTDGDLRQELRAIVAKERSRDASEEMDIRSFLLLPEGHDIKIWWERRDRMDPEVRGRRLETTADGWLRIWRFQIGEFVDWAKDWEQAICLSLLSKFTFDHRKKR